MGAKSSKVGMVSEEEDVDEDLEADRREEKDGKGLRERERPLRLDVVIAFLSLRPGDGFGDREAEVDRERVSSLVCEVGVMRFSGT